MTAGVFQRLQDGRAGAGMREVRARYRQRTGRGDVLFVNILRHQRHIGTIITVKNEREGLLIFNAQHHQRGKTLFIRDQVFGVDPGPSERFA